MARNQLTPKQRAFCEYYISSGNATESAIKAGYSKKTATVTASENLTKPNIKKYLDSIQQEATKNNIITATERKEWLTRLIEDKEIRTLDKLKALDLLNRMEGLYNKAFDDDDMKFDIIVHSVDPQGNYED